MTTDTIAFNIVLFVVLVFAIRTLVLQVIGHRQYHKLLAEVHQYNLATISHDMERELIRYSDLPHYPMFFTTAKAHKIRLLSNAIKSESSVQFEDNNTHGRDIVGE